jgi:ParB/RepB/Spo0J family partition protein
MNQIKQIKVSDIVPTKDNKRVIDVKEESFIELMDSIKAGGVRVPVHVRPVEGGKFELRAGQRRWTACMHLKIETIPAIVHDKMDDTDALDLTYIENKFRENLKPMEEVEEIVSLMDRFAGDAKKIAERIGKPEGWVRVRANIHGSLIKEWKNIFENLENFPKFQNWSIAHLTLIARLPAHLQKQFHDEIKQQMNWGNNEKVILLSVKDLQKMIANTLNILSKAKWNLDDETLIPVAGACSKCPKRTGFQPVLWFEMDEQNKAADQCLDAVCWNNKSMAYLERKSLELKSKYPNIVYITTEYVKQDQAKELHEKFGSYLDQYSFTNAAKKSDKDAVPALVLHGKGEGTLRYIKLKKEDNSRTGKRIAGTPKPLKERRAALDAKRWAQVLLDLRKAVKESEVEDLYFRDIPACLMSLAGAYGISLHYDEVIRKHSDVQKIIDAGQTKAQEFLWSRLQRTLDNILTYNGPITQTPKEYIDNAKWIAELVQADIQKMFDDVSDHKGFTEPSSWKSLNMDGTPKATKTVNNKKKPTSKKPSKAQNEEKKTKSICA